MNANENSWLQQAKEMSDEFDRKFSYCHDTPIRRTWERYLPGGSA